MNAKTLTVSLAAGLTAVALGGCAQYVKRDDFNAQIEQLKSQQAELKSEVEANKQAIADLKSELESKLSKYDAEISKLQGRISVDNLAHFAFNKATLEDQDKPALNDFAAVMKKYYPDAVVTVEGFADAAGSTAYNKQLGLRRAQAVRKYLIAQGMNADKVRAVSYGKVRNRQVVPGAWGDKGAPNRRATLVIDYVGQAATGNA